MFEGKYYIDNIEMTFQNAANHLYVQERDEVSRKENLNVVWNTTGRL